MKHLRSAILATLAIGTASLVMAGPPPGGWTKQPSLSTVEDFASLKSGDQVAQVCKMCDSISVTEIESTEQAMQFCKEGASIDCPSCKNKAKVVHSGPGNQKNKIVRFVDDHGEACMLMTKMEPHADSGVKHEHRPNR